RRHDPAAGRDERDPQGALRGGGDRRRQRVPTVLVRDVPAAHPGDLLQPDHGHHRLVPGVRTGLHPHRRRAGQRLPDGGPDALDEAFRFYHIGYGSAIGWVLFIVIMAFTALAFATSGRWVFYESEVRS